MQPTLSDLTGLESAAKTATELLNEITTEEAVTLFGAAAGLGGFAAQVIASQQLSALEEGSVRVDEVLLPALGSAVASGLIALALPGELEEVL